MAASLPLGGARGGARLSFFSTAAAAGGTEATPGTVLVLIEED